ncbi:MAG: MerR family transcriptional regulator [Bacilli bacterium]|nr:MerR family transcriptional regulator [Bacilli bacterium]
MYRIGEFSKLTNLSVRTLRFYDELGLLIPEEVDIYSNYRYYGDHNLEEAKKIHYYKSAGFTLEEIRDHWNAFTDDDFLLKRRELEDRISHLKKQVQLVDYLREQNRDSLGSVKVKKIERKY